MAIKRIVDPFYLVRKKNYFLFGPRSTGKSWLIRHLLPKNAVYINLLSSDTYLRLVEQPSLLEPMIQNSKIVVIDEIQKLPILLDEVHRLIEEKEIHFLLTGSSARRLKREHANMLGGRAAQMHLYGLTSFEIKNFNLDNYLLYGGLPRVHLSQDPLLELESYVHSYLEQEIQLESNIRNLPPFSRFLKVAALANGQLINYNSLASDCGISANTVKEYYQILIDTLIGSTLEPWLESRKRKAISTAKFYFFDTGVRNFICGINSIVPETEEWGNLFEQFIINEVKAYLMYHKKRKKMYFWRNTSKHEVDLIIDKECAIEIKSSKKIQKKHLAGFYALREENIISNYFLVSKDPIDRTEDGIVFYNWKTFLRDLWASKIF
jgi:predicted AAA+ superfamily ATPase